MAKTTSKRTPKKKDAAPAQEKGKKRTIDLLPVDVERLSKLRAHYLKGSLVDITESAAMRLGWQDACIFNGLEPRRASTVEPIGRHE